MKHCYLPALLVGLAQPVAAQLSAPTAPTDTQRPRPAFRGGLPDSLAALPAPAGTLRLQGQEQPIRPFLTIQDQLRTVAGVQVTPYDGSPGSGNVVRIRGANVTLGQAQPIYIIDGLPALNDDLTPNQVLGTNSIQPPVPPSTNNTYNTTVAEQRAEAGASPLQLLPPEAIESIEVLAGPAAVARYGPLAANGVISIRTRRGRAGQPLRVRYSAYGGVQQVRRRYDLLDAGDFAAVANESVQRYFGGNVAVPYPSGTPLPANTDWQAEAYRVAGLQQHQVSLEGSAAHTTYQLSADYRQQAGVLRNADLHRYGLRLALGQQLGTRLSLRGTLALGQTDQRLPYTTGGSGVTRAVLMAPPTAAVRTAQGDYSTQYPNYPRATSFTNPLSELENIYRTPRTRRLLTQLSAEYQVAAHLTVQASANFQRTLLYSAGYTPLASYVPGVVVASGTEQSSTQTHLASQWAGQVAVHYQRQLGQHHQVGAELDYQYQAHDVVSRNEYSFSGFGGGFVGGSNEYRASGPRLHRPWARVHYALDSTLEVEASLSYGHYRESTTTEFYPSGQVRWHLRPATGPALSAWVGAGRTGVLLNNFGLFGRAYFQVPTSPTSFDYRPQYPLRNDQLEAGLRLASRSGRLSGQLVAYQRTSSHALASTTLAVPGNNGYTQFTPYSDDTTIRNQGLELAINTTWQAGRWQGTTALVGSANRNRVRNGDFVTVAPVYDNQPVGSFYGYQQDGLTADGTLRYRQQSSGGNTLLTQAVLGSGIPAQLLSLSQQLRRGRWGFDAQVDALLGYQVLNYQRAFLDTPTGFTNNATTVLDRWTPTHQNTAIPAANITAGFGLYAYDGFPVSDRLLENGSHVRLSSLTITYRLRQTSSSDLSVWAGAQNLFVLTSYQGYDPNVSSGGSVPTLAGLDFGAVPVPRTWLLGVRASL